MPRKKELIVKTATFEGRRISASGKTEKEAIQNLTIKLKQLEEGQAILNPSNILVKNWVDICFDKYKQNIAEITLKNQKSKVNKWIVSEIGNMKLKSVKPLHCQDIMNKMQDKKMASDTMRKIHQYMNFIFDKAIQNGYIINNPAQYITVPKGTKETRRAITESERAYILAVADKEPKYVYFLLMLYCGCRPSEVRELKGADICNIKERNMLHIRGTKTKNADRYVPIPDYLYERIPTTAPFDYMFTNASNKKMTSNNHQTLWNHFKRDLNIEMGCEVYRNQVIPPYRVAPDLTPYCLRHTYCTDLQQKHGVSLFNTKVLMGHADISTTANIYSHSTEDTLINIADIVKTAM